MTIIARYTFKNDELVSSTLPFVLEILKSEEILKEFMLSILEEEELNNLVSVSTIINGKKYKFSNNE